MAKGYGCVAKYAMQDEALNITAKGLCAYLCSLTCGGTTTWPRRENILNALRLCKTTYYKALSSLTESGYITISVKRVSGQWNRNIYTIVSNPKRFSDALPEGGRSVLRCAGMLSHGYGMIPRLAMQDPRMTIKEKALLPTCSAMQTQEHPLFPPPHASNSICKSEPAAYRSICRCWISWDTL